MLDHKVAAGLRMVRFEWVNSWLKGLSWKSELLLVMLLGFGLFIYSSTRGFFAVTSTFEHSWTYILTSQGWYAIVIYEVIAFIIISYILKLRGWTLEAINLKLTVGLVYVAILLMILWILLGGICIRIFESFHVVDDKVSQHVNYRMEADLASLILMVIINSVFEEFLLVGYLFKRLEAYHPVLIIVCGILIRMLFHSYQGLYMVFYIVPMGLIFGYYYYRYQKIWPLVIAHGMTNTLVFLNLYFQSLHR